MEQFEKNNSMGKELNIDTSEEVFDGIEKGGGPEKFLELRDEQIDQYIESLSREEKSSLDDYLNAKVNANSTDRKISSLMSQFQLERAKEVLGLAESRQEELLNELKKEKKTFEKNLVKINVLERGTDAQIKEIMKNNEAFNDNPPSLN